MKHSFTFRNKPKVKQAAAALPRSALSVTSGDREGLNPNDHLL